MQSPEKPDQKKPISGPETRKKPDQRAAKRDQQKVKFIRNSSTDESMYQDATPADSPSDGYQKPDMCSDCMYCKHEASMEMGASYYKDGE